MFTDGDAIESGSTVGADLCIVGAGPAGIAIARTLAGTGARIVMIESGGVGYTKSLRHPLEVLRNHTRGAQSLSSGETRGQPYTMLRFARARAFGGSTNALLGHGLQSRPLDPIDFERRAGFELSGWPIAHNELESFYERAAELCGLGDGGWDAEAWRARTGSSTYELGETLESTVYRYAPAERFASYAEEFVSLGEVEVVTNATVARLRSGSGGRVRSAEVRTLRGNHFAVEASTFVVASGAIENARLLLLSNAADPAGLGNQQDLVGRCFMEHPEVVVGRWRPTAEAAHGLAFYERQEAGGELVMGQLRLTDEAQGEHGLLNGTFELNPARPSSARPGVEAARLLRRSFGARSRVAGGTTAPLTALRHLPDIVRHVRTRGEVVAEPVVHVEVMAEQEPNPESRVLLGKRRDRLGMRGAVLDWRLTERDFDSIRRSTDIVATGLEGLGGRFEGLLPARNERVPVFGNWHHIGTTRMAEDPARGVVDAECRVHGVENLYVAGSSVFPTGGCSNPTLTLVALALRLGDRLRGLGGAG
jgi:choline dehydrogenase-like flavoprotein